MKLLKKLTISMVKKMEVMPTKTTFRNYLFFWSGQLFSLLSTMVVDFIIIWWIQIRTGSVILLSLERNEKKVKIKNGRISKSSKPKNF